MSADNNRTSIVNEILQRTRKSLGISEYFVDAGVELEAFKKGMYVKFLRLHPGAKIPEKQTELAAGADLHSVERVTLMPMTPTLVSTGLSMEMSPDLEAQIRPRSGLSLKGITVFNSPGTIDADYRGDIKVILVNINSDPVEIPAGSRIAQIVFQAIPRVSISETANLSSTSRGHNGFGSTGYN